MRDLKPILANDPPRDPNREALATAITAHAGAVRDLQVAEQAAKLAAERCWNAQSKLDELRNEPPAPSGAFAAEFTASIVTGNPCTTATLGRASVAAGAKLAAAENEVAIWNETRQECEIAVRSKDSALAAAKEQVEKTARMVIANSETVTRLMDGVEEMTAQVINRRVALRYILFNGLNGELAASDREKIEELFRTDRLPAGFHSANNWGWEMHGVHRTWQAAFEELQSNSEAELPS